MIARAFARDGICIVLRAVLKAIEVPPPPAPKPPAQWSIKVYGEDGTDPISILSTNATGTIERNG